MVGLSRRCEVPPPCAPTRLRTIAEIDAAGCSASIRCSALGLPACWPPGWSRCCSTCLVGSLSSSRHVLGVRQNVNQFARHSPREVLCSPRAVRAGGSVISGGRAVGNASTKPSSTPSLALFVNVVVTAIGIRNDGGLSRWQPDRPARAPIRLFQLYPSGQLFLADRRSNPVLPAGRSPAFRTPPPHFRKEVGSLIAVISMGAAHWP